MIVTLPMYYVLCLTVTCHLELSDECMLFVNSTVYIYIMLDYNR